MYNLSSNSKYILDRYSRSEIEILNPSNKYTYYLPVCCIYYINIFYCSLLCFIRLAHDFGISTSKKLPNILT